MKLFDGKSLSGIVAKFLVVSKWVIVGLMIIGIPLETLILFYSPEEGTILHQLIVFFDMSLAVHKSIAYKILMIVRTIIIVPTILILINKIKVLFFNMSHNKIFIMQNIIHLESISKLVLLLSIISLNILSFLISIILWILVAVFRQGTELQEENDLTV